MGWTESTWKSKEATTDSEFRVLYVQIDGNILEYSILTSRILTDQQPLSQLLHRIEHQLITMLLHTNILLQLPGKLIKVATIEIREIFEIKGLIVQ